MRKNDILYIAFFPLLILAAVILFLIFPRIAKFWIRELLGKVFGIRKLR